MSFYRYSAPAQQMGDYGIVPLIAAALPLIQSATASQPFDQNNPYAQGEMLQQTNPLVVVGGVVAGLGLVGGLLYLLWKT